MNKLAALPFFALLVLGSVACAAETAGDDVVSAGEDELRVVSTFTSTGTGYYPDSSALEGGFVDMRGARLRTLQSFLAGNAAYVSVAMDKGIFPYGTRLRIAELNAKYGREIIFRVVDTGGAFRGKGTSRIDICTGGRSDSLNPTINGRLSLSVINERDPAPAPAGGAEPNSKTCSNDGACNPGSDGAGLVCQSGRCVAGCRSNAQCPGVYSCQSGMCKR
jgi:3D (Asp-Asp-Asp) domain-containing protein